VMFTYGRDIRLTAEQKGEPRNYFIYPHAESNGQAIKDCKHNLRFVTWTLRVRWEQNIAEILSGRAPLKPFGRN
jgi:hypothetical protein